ncbi:MAG: RNA polymerase sigma factor, partial [Myxococcales bacterium]|nr:RNA polymerase sigma factor [Myxococcales bacterium]
YRRLARHRRLDFDRDDADVEHTDLLPDDQLAVEQNRRLALAALDHLDADRRELLIMHDLNDIPASQIAEMLSIPTNTVYSRLRLAREDFRKVVQNLRGARGLR